MKVIDSRRLTGPSLLLDAPGAILDLQLDERVRDRAIALWRAAATRLLEQVGWPDQHLVTRGFSGGASLAFTAPPDALYAATEVNEAAWAAAWAEVEGRVPEREAITAARLRQAIADERNPALVALREGARVRQLTFLAGEGLVSVGSGTWSQVWASTELPRAESVDWLHVHDIPVALVTGSNGKTTVVRLLAAIAAAAEYAGGITSTDGVSVKGVSLAEGDYSGPSGARLLLRRRDVQLAVLETARGGLLRRGLSVDRAAVAVVTNVADDHLGEFGIQDLEALADVKMLVTRALRPGAEAVLNGDDPRLRARGERLGAPVVWFTLEPETAWLARHLKSGGRAAVYADRALFLAEGSRRIMVARVEDVPIAVGGAARHNVANALAAVGAAVALGLPLEAITRGLARFGGGDEENVGRANVMELGDVQVVVDYAHNPHGMAALAEMVAAMPARRRLVLLGQAGDRSDGSIRELARAALALRPDRIVLKEMDRYLRGRRPGEVTELMADELINAGVPPQAISRPGDELAAVRDALAWARPGDVLLLTVHQDRPVVLALLERLRGEKWSAGTAVDADGRAARPSDRPTV
jgi:UDP-N-acetylmuramyl tripeptide synthase